MVLFLIIWLAFSPLGWGQERERFQIITGFSYLEGDFGHLTNRQDSYPCLANVESA
jgi:hypothetical protein